MKTTLTRLLTVMMLIMVSIGAKAQVKVLFGENGDDKFKTDGEKIEATYDGGTIVVTQKTVDAAKVTVYLTVTPNKGYTMQEKNVIEAYAVIPADANTTRALTVSEKLTPSCDNFKDEYSTRTYYVDIDPKLALWVKSATFVQSKRDGAKATTDFNGPNGYYYLGNEAGEKNVPRYDDSSFESNYYMCPAYSSTVDALNYHGPDVNMPLITTLKSFTSNNKTYAYAIWYLEAATGDDVGYYYIKHVESGKYLVANDNKKPKDTRRRVNLLLKDDNAVKPFGDFDPLFKIQTDDGGVTYYIRSKTKTGANSCYFLNPSYQNYDNLNAQSGNDNTGGIIGFWSAKIDDSAWHLMQVPCDLPVITYDNTNNKVTITSTEGATIYYSASTSGTEPSAPTSSSYDGTGTSPITISGVTTPTIFKAIAIKSGYANSEVATQSIEKLVNPTVTFVDATQKVTITKNSDVEGATSVYTTDENDPIPNSTEYSEAISLTGTTTVKAMNVKDGYINSDVVPLTVTKLASSPSISISSGTVTLGYTEDGTAIYYTTDGTTPTQASSKYNGPFSLGGNPKYTIKAIATKAGFLNSDVKEQVVDNRTSIPVPTITHTYNTVTITASDYGDEIYYTIDGNDPTTSTATHFTTSGSFDLDYGYSYTIKAIASNGEISSLVATETIDLTDSGYAGIYYIHNTENGGEYYMYPVVGGSALVTTAKKTDQDAIWKIKRVGDYYQIIHYKDGKYLVAKDLVNGSMPDTETVSLVQTDSPGENALFEITRKSGDESDILQQIILIRPKAAPETTDPADPNVHNYLNKRGGNTTSDPIGLWNNTGSSQWTLVTVPAKPIISVNGINVTISSDLNNVYFTTDGTTNPTKDDNLKYNGEFTLEYGPSYIVKAVCIYHDGISDTDWTSEIATSDPIHVALLDPIITRSGNNVTIDNSQASGVTFRYTFSDDGSLPEDPVPGGAGNDYTSASALPLTANARNAFKAIAYNIVDGTPYTSDVVTFDVDFRSATTISSLADITSASGYYKLGTGFRATGTPKEGGVEIGTSSKPFKGIIDGNLVEFELGSSPLFDYVQDATIKNVIISKATISTSGNAGAIANNALGVTRIYNCGVLATGSTVSSDKDGYTEITTCSSTISGSGYVGGIVGLLDGSSRVINCFSYANITGGDKVGGIVGWNNVATNANSEDAQHYLKTMVMNCMFYGDITGGTSKAPIYNGEIITNDGDADGVNNFNYFWAGASYVQEQKIDNARYNCALAAETRFLQRFEFFRHLLNSNRELAAWWATGDAANKDEMMKWVMEPSQIGSATPYPILKAPDRYPSVVNIDVNHSETYKGRDLTVGPKLGSTLSVTIRNSTTDAVYGAPTGANITTASLSLNIMGKDPGHFNFNYGKVQLPYYNDVGTKNYTGNRVVTGWKIVSISDGTTDYSTDNDAIPADAEAEVDANGNITLTTPYNFADRKCTQKDLYGTGGSNRVFSQGAYWDVPEGVTAITIEPYWGKAVYLSDAYWDVTYKNGTGTDNTKAGSTIDAMTTAVDVTSVGGGQHYSNGVSTFNGQLVYTSMSNAIASSGSALYSGVEGDPNDQTVYDYAVVLVGNYHHNGNLEASNSKPYTVTSVDLDGDNEPDYSYILRFNGRLRVHPVRIDFLNAIGLGMAQKSTGGTGTYNFGIMQPKGWFESTNTSVFRFTQFEYDYADDKWKAPRANSPMILQGGVIEQWVTVGGSEQKLKAANSVTYYHVGGNVWFKEFHLGVHQDKTQDEFVTPHPPISVTGGDYDEFYLTGLYNTPNANYDDNAECYINGGRFGKVAGTGMQGIGGFTMTNVDGKDVKTSYSNGNIIWQIDNADIDEFYAGGINAAHIAEGNIYTVITNSRVDQFCGGPKFGNMNSDKKVVTNAENCTFRAFFGAGYGGNSYNRRYPSNQNNKTNINWNSWLTSTAGYDYSYDSDYGGVETRIDYQFLPMSSNILNVARLFVDYVSFSLATTHDVTSKLTGCTITTSSLGRLSISDDYKCLGNFYGGGSLGMVDGPVKSTLTNCTVEGNVFGGGYSATLPTVKVMNRAFQTQPHYDENLGAYLEAKLPATVTYTWQHRDDEIDSNAKAINTTDHILYTNEDLTDLGKVTGNVTLTIDGNTILTDEKVMSVAKSVYGGGEESNVAGNTQVNINGGTITQNVYGGGKGEADEFSCSKAMVGNNGEGAGADLTTEDNKIKGTIVTISNGRVNGNVYGGGEVGRVEWNTQVKIGIGTEEGTFAPEINGSVFGAGKGKETHGYAALVRGNSTVTIGGNAKVRKNVYGGGEQATVGRYWVKGINNVDSEGHLLPGAPSAPTDLPDEMPYKTMSGGQCTVIIQGSAQIGPDDAAGVSKDAGQVFGAGKGVEPLYVYNTGNKANWSRRMVDYNSSKHTSGEGGNKGQTWDYSEAYTDAQIADVNFKKYVWEYFVTEDKYFEFLQSLALVTGTDVTINGGTVKGNLYGGSESGFVQDDTDVKIQAGEIGTSGTTTYGHIFGGGKGLESFAEAGKVKGNTEVAISGSNTKVNGNVYGGGELGDVGIIDKSDKKDGKPTYNYAWKQTDGTTANVAEYNNITGTNNNTGICKVTITGGTIGSESGTTADHASGHVFGAGRGSETTWWCEKAIVFATNVSVSGSTVVYGNVYGGGQVGRVEDDGKVTIGTATDTGEGSKPNIKGDVFGAGAGLETHGYSALLRGNATVTVQGIAQVGGNVYGGGEIASVGKFTVVGGLPKKPDTGGTCIVNIKDNAKIGKNDTDDHNVFGACKGVTPHYNSSNYKSVYSMQTYENRPSNTPGDTWDYYVTYDEGYTGQKFIKRYYKSEEDYLAFLKTLALTSNPHVTIGGTWTKTGETESITPSGTPTVYGSVYGGGQRGVALGNVDVNMVGGTVEQDVYGGGALADTNLGNWDVNGYVVATALNEGESITDLYEKTGTGTTDDPYEYTKITDSGTTFVSGTYYRQQATWAHDNGSAYYTTTVDLTGGTVKGDAYGGGLGDLAAIGTGHSNIMATVYGDISVNLGKDGEAKATVFNISYYDENSETDLKESEIVKSGRVFGCNNLNGSPQGNVTVTVYSTGGESAGSNPRTAQGKLKSKTDDDHHYQVSAVYGGGNLANYEPSTSGKKANVIIKSCANTSILTVYGGGNAAAVPETDVDIYGAYEIGAVFGGGNGKDPYTLDNGATWNTNSGANVNGNANTMLYGGLIHEAFGGSNEKGTITGNVSINTSKTGGDCTLDVGTIYGAGKNADIDGDLIMVLGCKTTETEAVYGGAENANVKGKVELTITSGKFGRVFGGNNTSGAIFGSITLNIMESGCSPIEIDELYGGGYLASYSIYGYYVKTSDEDGIGNVDETAVLKDGKLQFVPRVSADDPHLPVKSYTLVDPVANTWTWEVYPITGNGAFTPYKDPVVNIVAATSIGKVFGGGYGEGAVIYGSPTVNINQAYPLKFKSYTEGTTTYEVRAETLGEIGTDGVYGGGNQAKVVGNTTINIGTEQKVDWTVLKLQGDGDPVLDDDDKVIPLEIKNTDFNTVRGANIAGNVYGGGNEADVSGNTFVNICAVKSGTTYNAVAEGSKKVTIAGNVFGGGKGITDNFYCDKAMVGEDGKGSPDNLGTDYPDGNTSVIIGNGTVNGNVYGGGEVGRVEMNTTVTVGLPGTVTSSPDIKGDVFGGGMGDKEHGYAGLVRGNPTITIQANAKVEHNVYGGGEIASVARYKVPITDEDLAAAHSAGYPDAVKGRPYALKDVNSGFCTVTVQGNAVIGPDYAMEMTKAGGPDDAGHVFGAGKGIMPENYDYDADEVGHKPRCRANDDSWTWFGGIDEYIAFIQTLALSSQTTVNIGDASDSNSKPFIKGSVYGGSENGLVQFDTNVNIIGGQIGCGKNANGQPHPADIWGDSYEPDGTIDYECASWDYGKVEGSGDNQKTIYAPYDPFANAEGDGDIDKYPAVSGQTAKLTEGGRKVASDGHTYYGNVFGGGSGSVPYFDTTEGISKYLNSAGTVKGNTNVTISGGHILTSVYGGCEATNVMGTANVTMTGGTIGVPRTDTQILAHPVTCNLFGAGKGDQRVFFNKDTNVNDAVVTVSGGRIYGSVFGGGEDGHIMRNSTVTISGANTKIGTKGTSYMDGNVFGGGRGFGGDALTAGNVGGAVTLNIENGYVLGSVYGGGRLASVGYGLYLTTETGYGEMRADDVWDDPNKPITSKQTAAEFFDKGRGKITINISGGTIGNDVANAEYGGNVFGGSMGSLTKQDGTLNTQWDKFATAKKTTVNVSGGTIKRSVYGGGELGTVTTDAVITVSGGTIGKPKEGTTVYGGAVYGNIYGGGKGYVDPDGSNYITAGIVKGNTYVTVENSSTTVGETTTTTKPTIYHNIYGGGAYGSVGDFTYDATGMPTARKANTTGGTTNITITGGTIGTDGKENGMIFGSSRGDVDAPGSIQDKLAWVYDTHVTIGTSGQGTTLTTPLIKGSVYGSGENGHTFNDTEVIVHSGTIGIAEGEPITDNNGTPDVATDDKTYSGAAYPYRGNVYGGGCGTDKYYQNPTGVTNPYDGNGDTYNPLAGIVYGTTTVTMDGGKVVRNVYGAGAMGSVGKTNADGAFTSGGTTTIEISGGTVGVDGTVEDGNVFGAARGDETTAQTDVALVKNTDVTISGNATVWGNVYGGGQIGCVGTFTEREADGKFIWTSDAQNLNGLSKVTISGGETKGHVFGAGRGKANNFKCDKAMVRETKVSVSNGMVDGNVYGGGEIGRVEEDAEVKIGVLPEGGSGTCSPTIKGSVFGAGAGLETHGYSALVRGDTRVTVEGGATVGQSVYGGGEIASVGRYGLDAHKMPEILLDGGYCYVKVRGSATIGSTTVEGNVFGACKGVTPHLEDKDDTDRTKRPRRMTMYTNATDFPDGAKISATNSDGTWEYYDESAGLVWEYFRTEEAYDKYLQTLALATHPEVTIDGGATVNGSVYGGGEMGLTKGSVYVNILGGTITKDVYGGGALANTNTTSAVGVIVNGVPQKKTDGSYETTTVHPTTTVNLLGGHIKGDAYGGGLGQLDLPAQGTVGQQGYQAAVPAIEAKVFGDVKVNLNGLQSDKDMNATTVSTLTSLEDGDTGYKKVKPTAKGAIVKRVFGCNNLNGSPQKKVQVYVYGTQNATTDVTQIANAGTVTNAKVKGRYDVAAVYGGGNLSPYVPADALLPYTDENKATVDAARTEVYIDGCDRTSIQQVYGGGNAASAPATFVQVNRCFEINEVFGGGNGFDDFSLFERGQEVYYKNSGANVGYYTGYYTNYATYGKYATRTSGGGSGTQSDPRKAVEDSQYTGGTDNKDTRLAAKDIQYGSGIARLEVKGGTVNTSYGGSNSKGNVRALLSSVYSAAFDECPMSVGTSYGGGKNAYSDADSDMQADCAKGVKTMFGGSENADFDGNINMRITNGSSLEKVFGGNNTSGAVNGSITITIEEGGCEPIRIGELYLGGFLAPYSVYGYAKNENGSYKTEMVDYIDGDEVKQKEQRIPLKKGDEGALSENDRYPDPRINVISATYIGNIFGGGYQAKLVGNPHINVNMTTGFVKVTKTEKAADDTNTYPYEFSEGGKTYYYKDVAGNTYNKEKVGPDPEEPTVLIATTDVGTIGNIYGGGNMADIIGDTYVEIGTGTEHNAAGTALVPIASGRNAAKITGNVFGGGKGKADSFKCAKAMVGVEDSGSGSTNVIIGNGTVEGSVYGGGEIGRVEANTNVTIGLEDGTGEPVIKGNVFGAGRGVHTHGYAALVRGNATVTVQGEAKVRKSVYGGGEIASVGKYNIADAAYHAEHPEVLVGMPYSLVSDNKGICNVIVRGNAVIGPEGSMEMKATGGPDDTGHVFGAGRGVLPYHDIDGNIITGDPWRMKPGDIVETFNEATFSEDYYTALYGSDYNKKLYNYLADYLRFIETLALTTQTEVTIGGNAFVKGSVYGGSENGHVQHDTHVTIQDFCQIGHSAGVSTRFTEDEWRSEDPSVLKECASWDYVATEGAPYDPLAKSDGTYDYTDYQFVPVADRNSRPTSEGGKPTATDGHTYYGNVFGGGSGVIPYAPGRWHREAGSVGGNTQVDITGGHIMTSVYGGNEQTDVGTYELDPDNDFQPTIPKSGGKCTINMTGGTLGVPRTPERMKTHPVTCYLFGAGKGDQRIFFNTWTNVINTVVNISGTARIYGSTFGGGEDGHVILNAVTNISGDKDKVIIGTTGTSYVDGNVFGGGRGFSGEAQTAGTVGGNVEVNISGGTMLGSIYGGGRLASVGTLFTAPDDPNYGNFVEDGGGKTYGHVAVNISGGIIGNTVGNAESGNVFGGSMGRLNLLNGNINPIWPKMAQVKETNVTISGNAVIKRTVYGGGELGTVRDNATVNINGGTVNRDVYGAGYGSKDYETKTKIEMKVPKEGVTNPTSASDYDDVSYVFTPMIFAGCVGQNTYVNIAGGQVKKSVYGGGEMASVGIMDCRVKIDNNATDPVYTEGTDKYVYEHFHSHLDENNGFALSWPFHFENAPGYFGATHVNITGGRIGLNGEDNKEENNPFEDLDNGDVYGGGKGIAGEYKNYVYCANVGSAEVTIAYPAGNTATPSNYMESNFIECIAGAVYGGAENGHVMGNTKLTLKNGLIGHSMYGGGSGKGTFSTTLLKIGSTSEHYTRDIYSFTAGKVFGNSTVEMSGGTVVRNVYGGGNMGSVGKGNYAGGADDYSTSGYGETLTGNLWDNTNDYSKAFLGSGKCTVNITGGTIGYIDESDPSNSMYPWNSTASLPYGNVFGGCRGESAPNIVETPRYLYSPEFFVGYANETAVTIGKTDGSGPTILGSVYGGGMDGHIRRDASVTILGGEIGIPFTEANKTKVKTSDLNDIQWLARGNVYGSGSGIGKYKYDFDYDGKYESTVKYDNGRATVDTKEEDYSTSAGSVTRFTTVDIKGGTIHRNVYGGGSLSSIGAPKIGQSYDPYHPGDSEHSSEVGKQSLNKVTISGGQIGDADCLTSGYGGEVNGGSRGAMAFENSLANPASFANSVYTEVTISDDADVKGNVFGGGEAGIVKHDTEVKMQGGTVGNDLYGAGDMADVNGNTKVLLTGGTVTRDVFGGARGTATIAANVGGDVLVDLNGGVDPTKKGAVVKRNIFGANNVNGTPQGHVLVYVHGTQNENTASINAKVDGQYDVLGVYGGGNQSDYVPASADTKQSTEVIIEGCELTSIDEVYGGGYGAATPATSVLVKGTKIINNVYGGGYGASTDTYRNPGANVGYRSDKALYDQGTGKAIVQLMAGTVNNVYGGSNTLGDIRGGSSVTNVTNDGSDGCCEKLTVGEIYGGGKQADMYGGAEIVLGCMPNDWIGAIYAGAENADIGGDVGLTLTSGKFERVFGGNNKGGEIDGYIEVNIEENPDCGTPIIIGELYGGGNMAPYAVPAKYTENNPDYLSPRVNVRAFTSIGNIYGGGLGAKATVTGNPLVNINEVAGGKAYEGETKTLVDGTKVTLYERKANGKMGVIGNVFGGGNAAPVIGNPRVEIGTATKQKMLSLQTKDPDGTVHEVEKDVLGADIRGNVYGGGNAAEVKGETNVVIGERKE